MATIYPASPAQHAGSHPHIQQDSGDHAMDMNRSWRTLTGMRTHGWQKVLVRPDIDGFIAFSIIRCAITLVSLLLLVTDIPRTGLGVRSLREFYPTTLLPSTAIRFGPFNYPVVHIWRSSNESGNEAGAIMGLRDRQTISSVPVWSYQFDTTSIGLRGAVELLNVTEFPSFLLYKNDHEEGRSNPRSHMRLTSAFTMIDALISSAQAKLRSTDDSFTSMHYATKHNWIDCIHHYVVSFITKNPAWGLHSIHAAKVLNGTQPSSICIKNTGIGRISLLHPLFCHHPGVWICTNPLNESQPPVRMWEHMNLRLQSLQRRYPAMELDVVFITSQRLSSTSGAMRSTFNNYEDLEVVTLTRGRHCTKKNQASLEIPNNVTCTTVFVDDYRYEREIIQTNVVDWYGAIALLRGSAQTYVWIRLVLFVYGAYAATAPIVSGKPASSYRWISATAIILKIPFQVIVYSSLLPVAGYVMALFLDSGFMDIFLDTNWASVGGGTVNVEAVSFLQATAVQMRCVWLLAMLATVVLFSLRKTSDYGSDGMLGIRGLLISFTSSLTVFGPYKNPLFRDVNNVSVILMASGGEKRDVIRASNPSEHFNMKSYISDDSAKMLLFCISAVCSFAILIKAATRFCPRRSIVHRITKEVILCSMPIVPCGVRRLWPMSTLSIRFGVEFYSNGIIRGPRASNVLAATKPQHGFTSFELQRELAVDQSLVPAAPRAVQDVMATLPRPTVRKRTRQPRQQSQLDALNGSALANCLRKRTNEISSVLLLMNITMMTDPWNFFCLRVLGIKLYLYKISPSRPNTSRPRSAVAYAVILPYAEDEMEDFTGLASHEYELLDSASSRDVPMHILLQSG